MSTLEQRITETLAPLLYGERRLQWDRKWEEATPLVQSAWNVLAREYAAAILPLIREAQAEAFDRAADCAPEYMPRNPYNRSNDE